MSDFIVKNRKIGPNSAPFIIAEMSGNHNQSLEKALKIVEAAAEAGVDAIKLQTYTADTLTLNSDNADFFIKDKKSLWAGKTLYELYKEAYTPWEWHKPIFDKCKKLGIIGFSTPFDETAVDFLEKLGVPLYKVASFENNHLPLIKKIAKTKKPMIISTGLSTIVDLSDAVNTARASGCKNLILTKCTSSYPADPRESNILTIPHMNETFDCMVGLSDHTLGIGVAVASVALGAVVIEKHFTLKRSEGGVDSAFSLEPEEMKSLVTESKVAWESLGGISYEISEKEKSSIKFKRSIYVAEDIKKGDKFNSKNLRIVRPGFGLSPKYYEDFLGRKASKDIKKGTRFSWDLILGKKSD